MEESTVFESKILSEGHETPIESRKNYWRNLVKKFEESGLTQKQFCELRGLNIKTLSRWKNSFKGSKKKDLKKKAIGTRKKLIKAKEAINFLSLELSEPVKVEEKTLMSKIVFRHESGFILELEESSNKELFRSGLLMLLELSRC